METLLKAARGQLGATIGKGISLRIKNWRSRRRPWDGDSDFAAGDLGLLVVDPEGMDPIDGWPEGMELSSEDFLLYTLGDLGGLVDDAEFLSSLGIDDDSLAFLSANMNGQSSLDYADAPDDVDLTGSADVTDGVDVMDGIPILTGTVVSYQQARLLWNGNTTVGRAAETVGLGVATRWGGTAAGAKAGAVLGTAFLPGVGTAVGAGIGAVFGRLGGGWVADTARFRHVRAAQQTLAMRHEKFAAASRDEAARVTKLWQRAVASSEKRLWLQAKPWMSQGLALVTEAQTSVLALCVLDQASGHKAVEAVLRDLLESLKNDDKAGTRRGLSTVSRWVDHLARVRAAEGLVRQARGAAGRLDGSAMATQAFLESLLHTKPGQHQVEQRLVSAVETLAHTQVALSELLKEATADLDAKRAAEVALLEAEGERLVTEAQRRVLPRWAPVSEALADFEVELRALGVPIAQPAN